MCYSAMVEQDLKSLARQWNARVDYDSFELLISRRIEDESIKLGKALEANFYDPHTLGEKRIKQWIDQYHRTLTSRWQTGLFTQKKRLADAERILSNKQTKKALEERRIATTKVAWLMEKLVHLQQPILQAEDSRIFPFWYAPVFVLENDEYVIKPMRYHCRPNGKSESYDKRYDGLYNARRDNLEGFWKNLFGRQHGFVIATSFFENVALHDFEKRSLRPDEKSKNLVLHFNPKPTTPMVLACLWDRWRAPNKPDLYSFTAITDEPPAEIAATGHNRCVVPLRASNVQDWMRPIDKQKAELFRCLDDRERPYYESQLAA